MPTFEITGPDGKKYRVSGETAEGALSALRKHTGAQQSQPVAPENVRDETGVPGGIVSEPAPKEPAGNRVLNALDYLDDTASIALRGARQGAANIAGLPVDLVNAAMAFTGAPVSNRPFLGSLMLNDLFGTPETLAREATGMPAPEADDPLQRVVERMGEEVGAMAIPGGMIASKASALKAAHGVGAPAAAREAGGLTRTFVEPAIVNPGRMAGREVSAATGAGIGAGLANEAVPDNPYADLVGAIMGAGATGIGSGLLRSGNEIAGAVLNRPGFASDTVRNEVADILTRNARVPAGVGEAPDTTDLVQTIMNGPRVSDDVPGVVESLADRTRNPGIAALEYNRQSGPNAGTFAQRRSDNAAAIDAAIAANEPTGNAATLRDELSAERSRRMTDASVETQNAAGAAETAVQPLLPEGTPASRGNVVRGALEDARDVARARTEDAYNAANISSKPIDGTTLSETLDGALVSMTQTERSLIPEGLIDRVRNVGEDATLKEATDLRSELLRLSRAAAADPRAERGGRNAKRVIDRLAATVDDFIGSNLTPEELAALDEARGAKFDEAEAFTRQGDPVAGALARNEGGLPRMRDERVASMFTNPQNMDRLFAQADTPETRKAIRDELLAGLDVSKADRIESFVSSNAEALERFPGLADDLRSAAATRSDEAVAVTRETDLQKTLGTDEQRGTGTVGKFLSFSDANSDRAIREIFAARDPAKAADELLDFVGDAPGAVEGARKAFWETMEKSARRAGETTKGLDGSQPWMPAALKRFLDEPKNSAVAERFYRDNPEHLDNIKRVADALQGLDIRNAAKAANTSGTAQSILPSTETLGSLSLAYQRGQIGVPFIAVRLASVMARRSVLKSRDEAVQRMLDDVLLDPDAAAVLLTENNPANRQALNRWAKVWFTNDAAKVMNALTEDDEPDEVKRAVGDGR